MLIDPIPSLEEYEEELSKHDWFFDFHDDHSKWLEGREERDRLKAIADISPDYCEAYSRAYNKYYVNMNKSN